MLPYWNEAWMAFEKIAFAHLIFLTFFEFIEGHIGFEHVSGPIYDKTLRTWSYVGLKTGYHYAQPPVL
jgi:hypothetical protein